MDASPVGWIQSMEPCHLPAGLPELLEPRAAATAYFQISGPTAMYSRSSP